jgi:NAD(P)-dependent dehydrogenase (short-subunit alcohol dehydrogenase family)
LGNSGYGATKGAVDMITKNLAGELAPYNITVNAIGPTVVMTEMMKPIITPDKIGGIIDKHAIKRLATVEDVAGACAYLASPEADYITGHILYVDGGLVAVG